MKKIVIFLILIVIAVIIIFEMYAKTCVTCGEIAFQGKEVLGEFVCSDCIESVTTLGGLLK